MNWHRAADLSSELYDSTDFMLNLTFEKTAREEAEEQDDWRFKNWGPGEHRRRKYSLIIPLDKSSYLVDTILTVYGEARILHPVDGLPAITSDRAANHIHLFSFNMRPQLEAKVFQVIRKFFLDDYYYDEYLAINRIEQRQLGHDRTQLALRFRSVYGSFDDAMHRLQVRLQQVDGVLLKLKLSTFYNTTLFDKRDVSLFERYTKGLASLEGLRKKLYKLEWAPDAFQLCLEDAKQRTLRLVGNSINII